VIRGDERRFEVRERQNSMKIVKERGRGEREGATHVSFLLTSYSPPTHLLLTSYSPPSHRLLTFYSHPHLLLIYQLLPTIWKVSLQKWLEVMRGDVRYERQNSMKKVEERGRGEREGVTHVSFLLTSYSPPSHLLLTSYSPPSHLLLTVYSHSTHILISFSSIISYQLLKRYHYAYA
jgi:hypothetical protein